MTRSRVPAGVAAVGIVAALVLGGAFAANAVPPAGPPVIDPALNGTAHPQSALPPITGTTPDTDTEVQVTLTPSVGAPIVCAPEQTFSGNSFSACGAAVIPPGVYTVTAVGDLVLDPGYDPSGASAPVTIIVYGTDPVSVTSSPAASSADATPSFAGTGPALGTVTVSGDGVNCSSAVAADGTWGCTSGAVASGGPFAPTADGLAHSGAAVAGDIVAAFSITPPPAPGVDQTFSPWRTGQATRDVQGNKDVDIDYIQVYVSTNGGPALPYCQATDVLGASIWYCDPPFGTLGAGSNELTAIGSNEADEFSAAGSPATIQRVAAPTIAAPADGAFTNDATPTFSGTTDPAAATATVYDIVGTNSICFDNTLVGGAYACTSAPLADGAYQYFVYADGDEVSSAPRTLTIDTVAPAGPVITGPGSTTTSTHPVITGTAEPFATIVVYRDGMPAACQEGTVTANSAGAWSCTSSAALAVGGTFAFGALQVDRAGNASTAGVPPAQLAVTVVPPSATPSPVTTPAPRVFLPWTFQFTAAGDEFAPGDTTRLTGSGLPAGASVEIEFHSTPVKVGTTTVADDGTFDVLVTIPQDAEPGAHRFVVLVTPVEGLPSVQERAVMVVLPTRAIETPAEAATAHAAESGGAAGDRSNPAAPSGLTGTIRTLGSILANPVIIGTAALSGLALLLLVAFPAELLNSTISEQYQRFTRRVPRLTALERFTNWLERVPWLGALLITAIAAVIFGFADPGFGFDVTSLRVVLACAIALFIVGYLASAISGAIVRGRWHLGTTMELKPLGLVLTVVGVVLSRLLDFSPGFLIGLLLGIGLIGRTSAAERAKATLVQAGVVFTLAMLGWIGYSLLMAGGPPETFTSALLVDTLVAVTTEGLTTLFVGLLPLRMLDGSTVFEHSKLAWAAAYTITAAAFVLIVVPSAWGELDGSLWTWIVVLGGFAIVAVGLYLYFRFVAPAPEEHEAKIAGAVESRH
ncbi:Ig-like domain-containing protein [Leifsonia sp. H3M29-4]|uniref:Ig-like domain-containing protein n=1 Tax=Salinibacterium metalliresistens TaxID=3031321 RepID=UPI0023DC6E15|nr:Ig-like domain-containing protein [Salinibacterium metalliresistens]MDF1478049.1 Ig-like domain-containing protein [Salinibacterium metalliresistens]